MTPQLLIYLLFPLAGYLLGSVPFAWVIGKSKGIDIRTVGSKNIGATNLGRTLGKKYFWYAFFLDAAKGFLPVLLASLFVRMFNHNSNLIDFDDRPLLPMWSPLLTAAACFLGHVFPIYLKFKGGKGVATSFGVVLGFWPLYTLAGLLAGAFFVAMLLIYRYISLASMSASLLFTLLVAALGSWNNPYFDTYAAPHDRLPLILVAAAFTAMIIWRHRANITRLKNGTEPQIGQREVDKSKM